VLFVILEEKVFNDHIQNMEGRANELMIPDFARGLDWFNSAPLSFKRELKGKVVVLDFWTYCCINCIHVLPDLAALEKKYADEPVVFIGVHSAKFLNEKNSENIRQAILRYDISHPVVNDVEMSLWRTLGISSWPTFIVVGPKGNMLFSFSGEGKRKNIDESISSILKYYPREDFNRTPLSRILEKEKRLPQSPLYFPGKLAVDRQNRRLFISDSNNHRIVVVTIEGDFIEIIGSAIEGFQDGNYSQVRFNRPQGIAYHKDVLYVADTENHALRKVDLITKTVTTLAGNGTQGFDYRGGNKGREQVLSTPWDVAVLPEKNWLFLAMAGTHQIWVYDLETTRARAYSGSGAEQNLNSDNPLHAAWSQPSGLTIGDGYLFIADSESSSIRSIALASGQTQTLVGGDVLHPTNLFCFGDQDGQGSQVRLQHPLGLLWLQKERRVLVADTYNHRVKILDPMSKTLTTWAGSGKPGYRDGNGEDAQFSEPSGIALSPDETYVFIADTNNHCIRRIYLQMRVVDTLTLKNMPQPLPSGLDHSKKD
jgi:thiol-disulfide isomerase/thioredoxin